MQRHLQQYGNCSSRFVHQVIWQRNGHDLPINSRYETAVSSTYFALTIRDVQDEDFANYTCRAKNSLGQNEYRITLTGTYRSGRANPERRKCDL